MHNQTHHYQQHPEHQRQHRHLSCHHQSSDRQQTELALQHRHHNKLCQRRHYGLSLTVLLPALGALIFLAQCPPSSALIVPNELPSILSLVYSNIPPIKKGTDSRVGFGFRLGEHADFQVMVELGPQKETRPIGDQDSGSSFNKRQVNKSQQRAVQREVAKTERPPANSWLEKWANQVNNDAPVAKKKVTPKAKPIKKQPVQKQMFRHEMPPMPQEMPAQAIQQLQMLYKLATTTTTEDSVPQKIQSSTTTSAPIVVAAPTYLQERLQLLKAPVNVEELQALMQKSQEQTKAEITKELMDVNLDE